MLPLEQIQTGEHDMLLMPALLLLHAGHSNLGFVKSLCAAGYAQGWRPVAMVYRCVSASGVPSRQSIGTFRTHTLQHSMHTHSQWQHGKACMLSAPQQHPRPAGALFHERRLCKHVTQASACLAGAVEASHCSRQRCTTW